MIGDKCNLVVAGYSGLVSNNITAMARYSDAFHCLKFDIDLGDLLNY